MNNYRQCVCGVPIRSNHKLCRACAETYTLDRNKWPEWLRDWMKNYQRELDYEYRHQDTPLMDEV